MKRFLLLTSVIAALALPALCQNAQLSAGDQREFDKAYSKWVRDTRRNDRDDIERDARRMQDIMARYNIPSDVPYDRIATVGNPQDNASQDQESAPQYQENGSNPPQQSSRLSADDQKEFDHYYAKWMKDSRKNDRDDVERDERHMRDIMVRYNISTDTPFDQIASAGYQGGYDNSQQPTNNPPQGEYNNAPQGGYNNAPPQAYPQNAPNQGWSNQARLSADDQREFDRYYSRWVDDSRHNDRDDEARDMHHMREIMSRNNIPPDVPVDQIASPGVANGGNSTYDNGYSNSGYNNNGYGNSGRAYANSQNRLSPDDQHEFDRAYAKWVRDSRRNDRDDLGRDERRMQDIMARYSIPSNTPYDQVASPNLPLGERH